MPTKLIQLKAEAVGEFLAVSSLRLCCHRLVDGFVHHLPVVQRIRPPGEVADGGDQ